MENSSLDADIFKKPTFPSEKPQSRLKLENVITDENAGGANSTPGELPTEVESQPSSAKPSETKTPTQPIPYSEPSWGGQPDAFYSLEEMKNGVSLRMIPLDQKSFYCFGRLDNCHIVMAHPTVSRYHAILQFRPTFSNTDEKKGFYVYDMGSTHGTFLNKDRVKPKSYVKLQVGHMIKFGSSTRFFLLHGPEEDQEEESNYTYTQLREMRKEELEKRQKAYLEEQARLSAKSEEEEAKGIDWGMGEDADEETDLTENPFAVLTNEEMYIDDPKKTLRCWFEREGEELNYRVEEKNYGQFHCSIELPLENAGGGCIIAEAKVSGKKKEAVFQCALEACRILDRNGLLKQNNQESRKRKMKNWEEDDYYDSDEDSFFDRTGDLESKRKQRMNQIKKAQPETDTYETLVEKHKAVLKEIEIIERKLNSMLKDASSRSPNDDENLDAFTSNESSGQVVDKLEQRKCKSLLSNLRRDEERLRKLINFVKPFELPEIKPPPEKQAKIEKETTLRTQEKMDAKNSNNLSSETSSCQKNIEQKAHAETDLPGPSTGNVTTNASVNATSPASVPKESAKKSAAPVSSISSTIEKLKKKPPINKSKELAKCFSNDNEEDFNNIVWAPPVDQSGDGRTKLNDRFGY